MAKKDETSTTKTTYKQLGIALFLLVLSAGMYYLMAIEGIDTTPEHVYICTKTTLGDMYDKNISCVESYRKTGFFGTATTHVCEGYGPVNGRACIEGKYIPGSESNISYNTRNFWR